MENKTNGKETVKLASDTNTSFTKILGIIFILVGVAGTFATIVMYDDVPYALQEEVQVTYLAIGAGSLLGNLAIGMILITLDRIANAIESK